MRKFKPVYIFLSVLTLCVGGVAYDLLRPGEAPIDPKVAEARVRELYAKSKGDMTRLTPEEQAEALKLRPIAKEILLMPGEPDLVEEKKLLKIWEKRGKRWKNMTKAEKDRAQRYMMDRRVIPQIQQSMLLKDYPIGYR